MSWLRSSPMRSSVRGRVPGGSETSGSNEYDTKACYDSFCKHWSQISEIFENSRSAQHDDVLGVVNHLDHMVTLLLVELHNCNKIALPGSQQPPAPCLEFLLSENLLDKLYEWSLATGRYSNAVRLEQLKLYELLVSHSRRQLLVHEPFLRPLLKLLASSQNEIFPADVGKRLVILLNALCVVLMQNVHLLDLFFFSTQQHGQQQSGNQTNFIIFSLLIPYVHCEGSLGQQTRDSLLLCMSLSQKNSNVGTYIAHHSSMSPVFVTGLCGLYSALPNAIEIGTVDWYRITADDVNDMPELTLFMNSLEFCNAVVQVAHPLIREQLLDFMYQGFLVPVLGPTLLQTNVESQISAMVYFDLILRSVTDPGLLKIMIKFLLDSEKFDEQRIIDVLIERINSPDSRLCMVTLSLFDTLLSLHVEEIMIDLILKYLIDAPHIPLNQKHKINKIQAYGNTVDHFLDLVPEVMKNSNKILNENNSLDHIQQQSPLHTSLQNQSPVSLPAMSSAGNGVSRTIGANWNHYGLHTGDTLYSNYHAYLFDAHQKIKISQQACGQWTSNYYYRSAQHKDKHKVPNEKSVQLIKNFLAEFTLEHVSPSSSPDENTTGKQLDSLQSIGESSGYESFKYRPEDEDDDTPAQQPTTNKSSDNSFSTINSSNNVTIIKQHLPPWKVSSYKEDQQIELDLSEDFFTQGTVSMGPFLTSIWSKLQTFTSNILYVNLQLTGLIAHLTHYPLPLLHSILLRPDIPTTSDLPSFYQVLKILKQQIDAELPAHEESLELIDIGRTFLIDREFKLINARKLAVEALKGNTTQTTSGGTSQMQSYDPFKRQDSIKRKMTNPFSNMFSRKTTATPQNAGLTNNIPSRDQIDQQPGSLTEATVLTSNSLYANERQKDLAISAVLLDEWFKELSAISQEQSIVLLNEDFNRIFQS